MPELVKVLQADGWRIMVLSTPTGVRFHDPDQLAELTRERVRVEYRMPGTGKPLPPADAVLACPLTFNSTNKFANGHADNFAIGLLCEMVGYRVPTVVVPQCKPQLADHPAFQRSLDVLRSMPAVTVLHDPHAPYEARMPTWAEVVTTLRSVATSH
ncbi:phosphopantothenoylcysteine synthetase/decarboxylase [Nocardiopsis mwathae]|uniref:Phosphopantothenoylcysteine synthetase/decarboxylase n=1 Tax=Nocardiopsis mwathae TaxID=1472723 RepID=A0A7W9YKT9_9ACTN|nr:phosphopantothenoylcysteine synthetase/decarboxylase [Nocardiopsis mwathae]